MKKICLLLCFISLLGCSSKVNYKLPTYDAKDPKDLLENYYNLTYADWVDPNYDVHYEKFDIREHPLLKENDILVPLEYYLFKYDELNIVMTSLDEYVCYKNSKNKIYKEDIYNIKRCPTIDEVVEKIGLPTTIPVNSAGDTFTYHTDDGYIYTFDQQKYQGEKEFRFQCLYKYSIELAKFCVIYEYSYDKNKEEYIERTSGAPFC